MRSSPADNPPPPRFRNNVPGRVKGVFCSSRENLLERRCLEELSLNKKSVNTLAKRLGGPNCIQASAARSMDPVVTFVTDLIGADENPCPTLSFPGLPTADSRQPTAHLLERRLQALENLAGYVVESVVLANHVLHPHLQARVVKR